MIIHGKHRFYSLAIQSDVLAATCTVDTRAENPIDGFQRLLDPKRAREIADYLDKGFGTIPCSIVLSAQAVAELTYSSKNQVLSFKSVPGAFLILDGQHRVYGFHMAAKAVRIPVVIYNGLTKSEEARLFIDINTKQRPVPNELLLDIKRMAESETNIESKMHDVFDLFSTEGASVLFGLMAPNTRVEGKISRVTLNAALKTVWKVLGDSPSEAIFQILNSYLLAWKPKVDASKGSITNATLLRSLGCTHAGLPMIPRGLKANTTIKITKVKTTL